MKQLLDVEAATLVALSPPGRRDSLFPLVNDVATAADVVAAVAFTVAVAVVAAVKDDGVATLADAVAAVAVVAEEINVVTEDVAVVAEEIDVVTEDVAVVAEEIDADVFASVEEDPADVVEGGRISFFTEKDGAGSLGQEPA